MPRRIGILCILAAAVGASMLRVPKLEFRTLHGDEANQMIRFQDLWENGRYVYDPHEYHGPTLYYLTLPSMWLSGTRHFADTTETHFRIVTVVFGIALVLIVVGMADGLGWLSAVCAAILTALSPTLVFYSRYYIQEPLLVFFTAGAIAGGWRYTQATTSRSRLTWAVVTGLCFGLMHATKETWTIAAVAMGGAVLLTALWGRVRDGRFPGVARFLPGRDVAAMFVAGLLIAFVLYTSFFTHWAGPWDSIRAFWLYISRSGGGIHDHPWDYYLRQLLWVRNERPYTRDPVWTEGAILALAAIGAIVTLCRRGQPSPRPSPASGRGGTPDALSPDQTESGPLSLEESSLDHLSLWERVRVRGGQPEAPIRKAAPASVPLARFLLFYTVLCTAIYALVPYKTPWCLMTFLHGMILLAGIGASFLIRALPGLPLRVVVALAMVAPMVHLGVQAYRSNFKAPYYNDERRNPWMYAHSHIDMRRLIARLEKLAAVHPWARRMPVAFFTQDVWPMPYYLRRYVNVGVWPGIPADPHAPFRSVELPYAPVWIVPAQHAGDLVARLYPTLDPQERERQLDRDYAIETFSLRHQVFLTVYIDRRLWDISIRR